MSGARAAATPGTEDDSITSHRILCRCCAAQCGLEVTVSGDRVIAARGDAEHPISHGYTCAKGRAYPALHHSELRLSYPMVRGQRVSWAECLDDIAGTIERLVADGGPDRVGYYFGTGAAGSDTTGGAGAAARFLDALGSHQRYSAASVDIAPLFRANELVTGFPSLCAQWNPEDDRPSLAILFGFNPVISHCYANIPNFSDPVRRIRNYRARGGRVWVVDPRRTETAMLADRHLPSRPGTDAAILAWLVRELLIDGADGTELETACDPDDVEVLRAAVAPFDLDRVVSLSGVDADDLLDMLGEVRAHRRIAVATGTGLSFGRHGIVAEWLRWALLIITGSVDRPGGMLFPKILSDAALRRPAPPQGNVAPGPASRPDLVGLLGERPAAAIVDEIEAGELRCLFVGGGNPLTAFPNPDRVRAALEQLDLCVVIDAFRCDMTDLATHVLPAAWHLERRDMRVFNRRMYSPPIFEPIDERKPTWWMFGQIAKRLGIDLYRGALDIDRCTEDDVFRHLYASVVDLDDAIAAGTHGIEIEQPVGWVHDLALPDGRWRLAPRELVDRLPEVWDRDDSVRLVPSRRMRNNNSAAYASPPDGRSGPPPIDISPHEASVAGIADGDRIRVTSAHGHVEGVAHIDERHRDGIVTVVHGWIGQNVGHLTDDVHIDSLTGQPVQTDIPVTIERLEPVARSAS